MHLLFQNNTSIPIQVNHSATTNAVMKMYRHLMHVDLPFRPQDNPFYSTHSLESTAKYLCKLGLDIGIEVDIDRCLASDQSYLNGLHLMYEKNYDGLPIWLDFHEHIHLCEARNKVKIANIDFREKAGPLATTFDRTWLDQSVTAVKAGDVFVGWAELGKTPYIYWSDHEPDDLDRLCELAKPWLHLKPRIMVAFEDIDFMKSKDVENFTKWWNIYHDAWCDHWTLPKWSIQDQYSFLVIGSCDDLDLAASLFMNQIHPVAVKI